MSNFTYLEGALAQTQPIWIGAHTRAFEYFGGASELLVSDSTKTGVTRACRYEPALNPTYQEMARHYGTVPIPTRPRKPRDNAKAESTVQVVERVVLAPLRDELFLSLAEVNEALREGRERLNDMPFQKLPGSQRTRFETFEKPALRPLPPERYELAQWQTVRANIDYHCQLVRNFYSVPYQLVHEHLEARLTTGTVELFYKGRRVASYVRLWGLGQYSTDPADRPLAHQKHLEWTPSRLIEWGREHGADTGAFVASLLASKPHPEQGYRACLGVMRLGKRYGAARLNAACARALTVGAVSYHSVKSILQTGLDRQALAGPSVQLPLDAHANVRGPAYYAGEGAGPQDGADAVISADDPAPADKPAPQMPQEARPDGREASGSPLRPIAKTAH
jgi:transposase